MTLIANWTNQLLKELELDMEMDLQASQMTLKVNSKQSVEIQSFREEGFLFRAPLGQVQAQAEEAFTSMMVGNVHLPESLPYVLSLDADNKAFITYSQARCSAYQQFRDDFEDFLNYMDIWTIESSEST